MSATDSTEIVNRALVRLAGPVLSDLDTDTGPTAVSARAVYDPARRGLLTEEDWHFASSRAGPLTDDAVTPAFQYSYTLSLPTGFLVKRWISNSEDGFYEIDDYVIEGNKVLTNDASVYMRYTKDITDTTIFHPLFTDALVLRIAKDLCLEITESTKLLQTLTVEYARAIDNAASADAIQSGSRLRRVKRTTNARYAGNSRGFSTEYNP